MSWSQIKPTIKIHLWTLAGGRCQYDGCNKLLNRDFLYKNPKINGFVAHIIADSPNGPRGDKELSKLLCKDINNLMLLCSDCHTRVDVTNVADHPATRLREMKTKQEARIELVTGIEPSKETQVLIYNANIHNQNSPINNEIANRAVLPRRIPNSHRGIILGLKNSASNERNKMFWDTEKDNLTYLYTHNVRPLILDGTIKHLSVFGLAPQPLLIHLGSLLTDQVNADIFQLQREPQGWDWHEHPSDLEFSVSSTIQSKEKIALIISLSGTINDERIYKTIGSDASVWRITIQSPNNDYLKTRECISEFRKIFRKTLDQIKAIHGEDHILNIFPSVSVATAIEIGRCRMPKADLAFKIFDQIGDLGFQAAIVIN